MRNQYPMSYCCPCWMVNLEAACKVIQLKSFRSALKVVSFSLDNSKTLREVHRCKLRRQWHYLLHGSKHRFYLPVIELILCWHVCL
ncbi:hypothetical protein AQUCO_01900145v1 [Aquilegia coerulea]|uniref:Uncharacterized protein n=1 Tax=Aquilegia coerulea TaxID=218851 RepID=A0A2G5DJV9_AQUCA|nr:hypothetical protein AQUCO_01900145v1 [Aquilegia coerulea]